MARQTKARGRAKKRTTATKSRCTAQLCAALEKRRAGAKRAAARRQEKILLARVAKGQRGRKFIPIRTTAPGPWAVGPAKKRGRKGTFKRTRVLGKPTSIAFGRATFTPPAPSFRTPSPGKFYSPATTSFSRDARKHYGYGWPADFAGHHRAAELGLERRRARKGKTAGRGRDWPGQPIRHKRAAALGWQRKLAPRRPKNPTFFGKRPVKSSAKRDPQKHYGYGWPADFAGHHRAAELGLKRGRARKAKSGRDWPGEPIRHKRASALGWQRKLAPRRPKNPTFFGKRPVKSSAKRDPQKHYGYGWPADFAGHHRAAELGLKRRRARKARSGRDWPGEPIRHKRAAALGWQRKLAPRRPKNPTFFGKRPVKSSAKRDHY